MSPATRLSRRKHCLSSAVSRLRGDWGPTGCGLCQGRSAPGLPPLLTGSSHTRPGPAQSSHLDPKGSSGPAGRHPDLTAFPTSAVRTRPPWPAVPAGVPPWSLPSACCRPLGTCLSSPAPRSPPLSSLYLPPRCSGQASGGAFAIPLPGPCPKRHEGGAVSVFPLLLPGRRPPVISAGMTPTGRPSPAGPSPPPWAWSSSWAPGHHSAPPTSRGQTCVPPGLLPPSSLTQ